jgi:ATP-dependent helicase/nuclease subunit B
MAVNFVDFEIDRRKTLKPILYEQKGTLPIDTSRGTFTLNARCDRIDIDAQSQAILVDYKTSSSSAATYQEVTAGFAPQLPLQAMMLKQGGFGKAYDISGAEYIILSNKIDVKAMKKSKDTNDEPLFTDLVDSIFAQFIQWIELFNDENTGYPSRRLPKFLKFTGDYDLLARVPEWSLTEDTDNNNDDDTTE